MNEQKRGGFRHTRLGVAISEDAGKAAEKMRAAWSSAGSATGAAKKLEISNATFWRYVDRLVEAGHDPRPRDEHGEPPKRGGKTGPRAPRKKTARA